VQLTEASYTNEPQDFSCWCNWEIIYRNPIWLLKNLSGLWCVALRDNTPYVYFWC